MSYISTIRQFTYSVTKEMMHEVMSVEHLLLALLKEPNSGVMEALRFVHFDSFTEKKINDLSDSIKEHINHEYSLVASSSDIYESIGFKRALTRATRFANDCGRRAELGVDILLGIYYEKESYAAKTLDRYGVSLEELQRYLAKQKTSHKAQPKENSAGFDLQTLLNPQAQSQPTEVEQYIENLNEKFRAGKLPPLIGRAHEIQQTIRILTQSRKSNPLLVGDAGVGKTTIAAGLAQLIEEGRVPMQLRGKEVFSLDLSGLMSGTEYRGAFEKRMKAIIDFFKGNQSAILFIDEIHMIVGAGSTGGSQMDIANILKPALASGEISCIGATTYKEFRQHVEKDEALTRRFQKIDIPEPSIEETTAILGGLKKRIEQHHRLIITDDVLQAAVVLSKQYIKERKLPDIAIDVLDEAGALCNMMISGNEERIIRVTDIEKVVANKANISLERLAQASSNSKALVNMADQLKKKIFGQDHAVDLLSSAIQLAQAGLRDENKPVGSFLFTGPTGVGKTELCKELAELLGMNMLRFDMSEYSESHASSKLIGAPPGYVGHDQSGLLTEAVNKDPQSIVLFDEIEKAHPQIYNILLQVMDYGTLTDSHGRKVDFRHAIIIFTSNAGAQAGQKRNIGFSKQDNQSDAQQEIARVFTPEFRNRLDDIIQFNSLPKSVAANIVKKLVAELTLMLKEKKVSLTLDDSAIEWFVDNGYDAAMGARPMARLVTNHLKKPLAKELLYGRLIKGGTVTIFSDNSGLLFQYT